jgi:purine-binding chemotaxis protein CheW
MDIAEIRKKAKKQAKPDEVAPEAAPEQELGPDQEVVPEPDLVVDDAGPAEDSAAEPGVPAVSEDKMMAAAESLDRISATEDLALATDESYAAMLEDEAAAQSQNVSQYLAFHLDNEEYALDIKQISEIIKVREFTEIPRSPAFVLGIISLRGVVVPVFDLRCRLNLGSTEITASSRIVVCQSGDVTVGLLVDRINQVVNLVDEEVEPPPGVLSGLDREMVYGIGRYQGRMIILLQLNYVLDVELN